METGAAVYVTLFVEQGDVLKIDKARKQVKESTYQEYIMDSVQDDS